MHSYRPAPATKRVGHSVPVNENQFVITLLNKVNLELCVQILIIRIWTKLWNESKMAIKLIHSITYNYVH